jgi:hypothetical protein
METIDLVANSAISKTDIASISNTIKEAIANDTIDPMLLQQHFKAVETIAEIVKNDLREASVRQMQKYPEKTLEKYGAEFKIGEFGTSYNYTGCGDPIWHELNNQIKELQEKLKKREMYLKSLDGQTEWINPATGEVCLLYPPVKKSTTAVACSIK